MQYANNGKEMFYKNLLVSGLEPRTSGFGSDRSANWATTTAQIWQLLGHKYFWSLSLWCA